MFPPFFAKYIGQQKQSFTTQGTTFKPNINYGDVVLVKSIDSTGNYLAVHDSTAPIPFSISDFSNKIDTKDCQLHMKSKILTIIDRNDTSKQETKNITNFKCCNVIYKVDSCKIDYIELKYNNNYSVPRIPISELNI